MKELIIGLIVILVIVSMVLSTGYYIHIKFFRTYYGTEYKNKFIVSSDRDFGEAVFRYFCIGIVFFIVTAVILILSYAIGLDILN